MRETHLQISIVPYNPNWPQWFELLRRKLQECLGSLAISIDHIGSTSVPGLGSKNRIDIQISVTEISDEIRGSLNRALISGGFQEAEVSIDHRPPGENDEEWNWKKLFLSGTHSEPRFDFNIHIRAKGSKNHRYALRFRDYLRSQPAMAQAYQVFKEKLAKEFQNQVEAYVELKDPVCDIIMSAADQEFH